MTKPVIPGSRTEKMVGGDRSDGLRHDLAGPGGVSYCEMFSLPKASLKLCYGMCCVKYMSSSSSSLLPSRSWHIALLQVHSAWFESYHLVWKCSPPRTPPSRLP
ncbi:hypothetical protein Hypma_003082 [Hypsizygus marmoreus]|uniref:Uncharacterized protein n=1 Tax=Hypsizygus marmoreus TaxID=39966 RepID=A0A369J4F9_HYPMA|nr:hypothetical protein Hypma_003082 [Hypsizygus marmoreus]